MMQFENSLCHSAYEGSTEEYVVGPLPPPTRFRKGEPPKPVEVQERMLILAYTQKYHRQTIEPELAGSPPVTPGGSVHNLRSQSN